jgi:hypothetical protein
MDRYNSSYAPNVIGVLKGEDNTDTVWAVSGHIDAVSGTQGADDNASGTSIVIRCAQVLTKNSYRHDIRFVVFTGEENGMVGSRDYAAKCKDDGLFLGLINFDMIGYSASFPNDLDLTYNNKSEWLADIFISASDEYVSGFTTSKNSQNETECSSDHKSFWNQGFVALSGMEEKNCCRINPYYHSSGDIIGQGLNDFDLTTNSAKVTVAALATLAVLKEVTGVTVAGKAESGSFSAVYNPINRSIELSLPENMKNNTLISIFNLHGRVVQKFNFTPKAQKNQKISINTNQFANGIYYLKVGIDSKENTAKIILFK